MKILSRLFFLAFIFFASTTPASAQFFGSTDKDRKAIDLVLYNDGTALVREVRGLELAQGTSELAFRDVPDNITPETVQLRSLSDPEKLRVIEQNYSRPGGSEELLERYIGKKIKIFRWNKFQDRKDIVEATLLSTAGRKIYQIDNEIYIGYPGVPILPEIPEGFPLQPLLSWKIENSGKPQQDIEATYLASQIVWKADYALDYDEEKGTASLSGWATIENLSGMAFENAGIKLVAGTVQRVNAPQPRAMMEMAYKGGIGGAEAYDGAQERTVSDYHVYEVGQRVSLQHKQQKQISLLQSGKIKIEKEYRVQGQQYYFTQVFPEDQAKQPVQAWLKMKNTKENGLGLPLPAGTLRVYLGSKDGILLGEDRVPHTAKDEEIKIKTGEAFDVTAERRQTDFRQVSANMWETEWSVTLRNHRNEAVFVEVADNVYGSWKVLESSLPYEKRDAQTLVFKASVPQDGETVIRYRVQTGY